jgi:Holliday junction resolvase-like predicted endonuclease
MRRAALCLAAQHQTADVRIDVVAFEGDHAEHIEGAIDFSSY